MKKKLTVNRLAFGNLRARKKQYTLMIIGIVLAMIFSSAAMFFAVCNEDSRQEWKWNVAGKQDFILRKCDGFDVEQFKQSGDVVDYATFEVIAYGYSPDDKVDDGMGIAVHNEKSRGMSHFYFLEGRYPEAENEIAIESDALYRMNLTDAEIGDEITLNLRAASGDIFLEKETQKTYILTGIIKDRRYSYEQWASLNRNMECPEYPAAIVYDGAEVEVGGKAAVYGLVDFNYDRKHSTSGLIDAYREYLSQNGIEGFHSLILTETEPVDSVTIESGYLIYTQLTSYLNDFGVYDMEAITELGTLLAAVLAVAACFGVINAFNTNLQERRKQIGMLRAVGATRRQIVKIFGREAFLISLICAPVSVAAGYFALKLFSYIMGEMFIFEPEWYVIIGIGIACICFVMAAALIPLIYAARVTPMQAIRNTELGRKMKNKKIKSENSFRPQRLIAKRSLVFHRFRQVSVSLILIATIIVSCFCVSLLQTVINDEAQQYYYDYRIFFKDGNASIKTDTAFANYFRDLDIAFTDSDIYDVESNRYVGKAKGKTHYIVNWLIDGEYPEYLKLAEFNRARNFDKYENGFWDEELPEGIASFFGNGRYEKSPEDVVEYFKNVDYSDYYKRLRENVGYEAEPFGSTVEVLDDEDILDLNQYLIDGKIDLEKLNSGEEIILVASEEIAAVVQYSASKSRITAYGKWYINDGLIENRSVRDIEIMREKMPFRAGETAKLSMLCNYENADETETENVYTHDFERYDKEVKIGAIVSRVPSSVYWVSRPSFVTTSQGMSTFGCPIRYEMIDLNINQEITPEIEEQLEAFFRASDYDFNSNYRMKESDKAANATLIAGIASIILLLFCIAASLVNNALTAKIREGKREIGTLRAVGASAKELTMIYIHQLFSMFGIGCGLGFGIYTVVFFAAKLICHYYMHVEFPFEFHILLAAAICLVLFAICSLNLYLKIKKQMKNSIVENIREL